jgi:hypothetical protein
MMVGLARGAEAASLRQEFLALLEERPRAGLVLEEESRPPAESQVPFRAVSEAVRAARASQQEQLRAVVREFSGFLLAEVPE